MKEVLFKVRDEVGSHVVARLERGISDHVDVAVSHSVRHPVGLFTAVELGQVIHLAIGDGTS